MAAGQINIDAYTDALVVLGTAGIVVPLVQRWRVSPVLGYLAAGAMLGPLGLGSFKDERALPATGSRSSTRRTSPSIAELGVVFLLFLIGLELSFERLMTMRRLVFGLGGLQVVLSARPSSAASPRCSATAAAASVIIGACLALSSTAIVIEVLSEPAAPDHGRGPGELRRPAGQDLAVVPMLLFVSILGDAHGRLGRSPAWPWRWRRRRWPSALIVVVGRLLLRPLFRLVASAQAPASCSWRRPCSWSSAPASSPAWPACPWRSAPSSPACCWPRPSSARPSRRPSSRSRACCSASSSSRSAWAIDVRELAREPFWLLASVAGLIAIKAVLLTGLARLFRVPWPAAIETGPAAGPRRRVRLRRHRPGHDARARLRRRRQLHAGRDLADHGADPAPGAWPRAASPSAWRSASRSSRSSPAAPPAGDSGHAIVIGHGRVGQIVCDMLERHALPVHRHRQRSGRGQRTTAGAAARSTTATPPTSAFLKSCGLMEAAAVIVTIHTQAAIDEIVQVVRALRPDMLIVSRARDADACPPPLRHRRHRCGARRPSRPACSSRKRRSSASACRRAR